MVSAACTTAGRHGNSMRRAASMHQVLTDGRQAAGVTCGGSTAVVLQGVQAPLQRMMMLQGGPALQLQLQRCHLILQLVHPALCHGLLRAAPQHSLNALDMRWRACLGCVAVPWLRPDCKVVLGVQRCFSRTWCWAQGCWGPLCAAGGAGRFGWRPVCSRPFCLLSLGAWTVRLRILRASFQPRNLLQTTVGVASAAIGFGGGGLGCLLTCHMIRQRELHTCLVKGCEASGDRDSPDSSLQGANQAQPVCRRQVRMARSVGASHLRPRLKDVSWCASLRTSARSCLTSAQALRSAASCRAARSSWSAAASTASSRSLQPGETVRAKDPEQREGGLMEHLVLRHLASALWQATAWRSLSLAASRALSRSSTSSPLRACCAQMSSTTKHSSDELRSRDTA